ncbi:MAG: hypothetical protein WDM96_11220 [Lacunisphaera sp.]
MSEVTIERKKMPLNPAASRALHDLVQGIVGAELARRLEMTQGMFAVLRGYDEVYDNVVRRAGRLTFADVQRAAAARYSGRARRLTRDAGGRSAVVHRLAARCADRPLVAR